MPFAFSNAAIYLALNCQCRLERHGGHEIEHKSSSCRVDVGCGNTLAGGSPRLDRYRRTAPARGGGDYGCSAHTLGYRSAHTSLAPAAALDLHAAHRRDSADRTVVSYFEAALEWPGNRSTTRTRRSDRGSPRSTPPDRVCGGPCARQAPAGSVVVHKRKPRRRLD